MPRIVDDFFRRKGVVAHGRNVAERRGCRGRRPTLALPKLRQQLVGAIKRPLHSDCPWRARRPREGYALASASPLQSHPVPFDKRHFDRTKKYAIRPNRRNLPLQCLEKVTKRDTRKTKIRILAVARAAMQKVCRTPGLHESGFFCTQFRPHGLTRKRATAGSDQGAL